MLIGFEEKLQIQLSSAYARTRDYLGLGFCIANLIGYKPIPFVTIYCDGLLRRLNDGIE